jgi:protein-arginine kinase activator protein McsA
MLEHAKNLEFEEAAVVRDEIRQLKAGAESDADSGSDAEAGSE